MPVRIRPLWALLIAFVVLMASNAWLKGIFGSGEIATDVPFLLTGLTLFGIGFSWGGYESLVQLVSPKDLAKHRYWGEGDNALVRLHIGLESPDDLIEDLGRALDEAQR